MQHKIIEQRTTEWYRARLGKFTASGFGKLMARPRYEWRKFAVKADELIERKAYEIYLDKYIYDPPFDQVAADFGIKNEAGALQYLQNHKGFVIKDWGLVFNEEWPDIAATPDGVLWDTGVDKPIALIQIKCPYNGSYHEKYRTTIFNAKDLKKKKSEYYWQMQGEMWVCGLENSAFVSFNPRIHFDQQLHIAPVERNETDIAILKERVFEAIDARNKIVESLNNGSKQLPAFYKPGYVPDFYDEILGGRYSRPPKLI